MARAGALAKLGLSNAILQNAWDLLPAIHDLAINIIAILLRCFLLLELNVTTGASLPAGEGPYSHTLQLRALRWLFDNVRP
jgi:hypothetical protein